MRIVTANVNCLSHDAFKSSNDEIIFDQHSGLLYDRGNTILLCICVHSIWSWQKMDFQEDGIPNNATPTPQHPCSFDRVRLGVIESANLICQLEIPHLIRNSFHILRTIFC
eukprot:603201_1